MTDTVPVEFQVVGIEPVHGRGLLVGLAIVEMNVSGVVLTLQGVQVTREPGGNLACRAPLFRHPRTSKWLPAMVLPPELRDALGAEVLAIARTHHLP